MQDVTKLMACNIIKLIFDDCYRALIIFRNLTS